MIILVLLPTVLVFGLFVFLFFREMKLDTERFFEEHRLADEHVLREVEQFLAEHDPNDKKGIRIAKLKFDL